MLVLGLSGGLDLPYQFREHLFTPGICHDAAAVLVEDGRVIAAHEEERHNRIKHSSKGAYQAIACCLAMRGIQLSDVDELRYYGTEEGCNTWMRNLFYGSSEAEPVVTYRQLIHEMLKNGLGDDIDDNRLKFVHHHLAHAISTHCQSGFKQSLTLTIDGAGDGLSGSVTCWRGNHHEVLASFPEAASLGNFYDRVIQMIGYGFTEEYKVMGLAPYGRAHLFRYAFERLYTLLPQGHYTINWATLDTLYGLVPVRKRGEPILQDHMDLAAALQQTLETIVLHVLGHFRIASGMSALCLAGGVAHNSTLNGKILYSGLFDEIFVQPASGDAGCALGAALSAFLDADSVAKAYTGEAIRHVFWGTDIGTDDAIQAALERWQPAISFERVKNIAHRTAAALAAGEVIGWVQGRAEFGPRALGHRSILADPRPHDNKERINTMVKKRESYRPFAPAVPEERCGDYFILPRSGVRAPFMSYTLQVRPEARELLGATTHVDGTARVQTVARDADPLFWELIDSFGQHTGVPVLLNTSFNNHAEPMVDSVDDAVTCFLTTGLQKLVIGSFIITKHVSVPDATLSLAPSLPDHVRLMEVVLARTENPRSVMHEIGTTINRKTRVVSSDCYRVLKAADGQLSTKAIAHQLGIPATSLAEEISALWESRLVMLRPPKDKKE